jgi:hypothetical protein
MTKRIKYNRENNDYDMFIGREYVGSRDTYDEAQIELDRLVYERLSRQEAH